MKRIHQSKSARIQNGEPFDWMLQQIANEKNVGIMSDKINSTDVSRHAIVKLWRATGHKEIPQAALDMLKIRIEDIDL